MSSFSARSKHQRCYSGPDDEDPRHPPCLPVDPKDNVMKKLTTKKQKYPDVDTARAAVVAVAAERAEARGARSGV